MASKSRTPQQDPCTMESSKVLWTAKSGKEFQTSRVGNDLATAPVDHFLHTCCLSCAKFGIDHTFIRLCGPRKCDVLVPSAATFPERLEIPRGVGSMHFQMWWRNLRLRSSTIVSSKLPAPPQSSFLLRQDCHEQSNSHKTKPKVVSESMQSIISLQPPHRKADVLLLKCMKDATRSSGRVGPVIVTLDQLSPLHTWPLALALDHVFSELVELRCA